MLVESTKPVVIDVVSEETHGSDAVVALGEIAKLLAGVTGKSNQTRVEKALELLKTVTRSHTGNPEPARPEEAGA